MEKQISGRVFVLGDDVDTDQIIPAKHLVYDLLHEKERLEYGKYALSGLPAAKYGSRPFVKPFQYRSEYTILVAGRNFGCGSSREHAPAALNIAGVQGIIAKSFARIFFRNCIDGGFCVPMTSKNGITELFKTENIAVIDVNRSIIANSTTNTVCELNSMGFEREVVMAGGLFSYARESGIISR